MFNQISDAFNNEHSVVNIFSAYKKSQSLKKKKAVAENRKAKVEDQISDISTEMAEVNQEIAHLLEKEIQISAHDAMVFFRNRFDKIKSGDTDFSKLEKEFFSFISKKEPSEPDDNLVYVYGEVTKDGHMLVCPETGTCEHHMDKDVLIKLKLDLRDMQNV